MRFWTTKGTSGTGPSKSSSLVDSVIPRLLVVLFFLLLAFLLYWSRRILLGTIFPFLGFAVNPTDAEFYARCAAFAIFIVGCIITFVMDRTRH